MNLDGIGGVVNNLVDNFTAYRVARENNAQAQAVAALDQRPAQGALPQSFGFSSPLFWVAVVVIVGGGAYLIARR